MVKIFGRKTPLELSFMQVEKDRKLHEIWCSRQPIMLPGRHQVINYKSEIDLKWQKKLKD
jgi:hypothetical protein